TIVQKTRAKPMEENQAQSTRKSRANPSAIRQATMIAIATPMPRPQIIRLSFAPPGMIARCHGGRQRERGPVTQRVFAAYSGSHGSLAAWSPPGDAGKSNAMTACGCGETKECRPELVPRVHARVPTHFRRRGAAASAPREGKHENVSSHARSAGQE